MALVTFPLIDYTYFVRDLSIPNIDPSKSISNAPSKSALDSSIVKYERECLNLILGYSMYKSLRTEDLTNERIAWLVNGGEYYDNFDCLQMWNGLRNETNKTSLIANYVYFCYQEDTSKQTTGKGTVVNKSDGGKEISPADKMIKAWNGFSEEVQVMSYFLWTKVSAGGSRIYTEFTSNDYRNALNKTRKINQLGF